MKQMDSLSVPSALLEKADKLNRAINGFNTAFGIVLYEIKKNSAWKEEYKSFDEYYRVALERDKSTVSVLVSVGEWVTTHGLTLQTGDVSYRRLYNSIKKFPTLEPQKVLANALTLSAGELDTESRQQRVGEHECQPGVERFAKCKCTGKNGEVCDKLMRV